MIIGIDIDDTITNTTELVRKIAEFEYPSYSGFPTIPEKKYKEFCLKYRNYIESNVTIKDNALDVLNYIKDQGHKIIIVTLRGYGKESLDTTIKYLDENNIPYDKIIGGAIDKGKVAKKEKIDLFIDDRSVVIKDLIKHKIPYIKMYKEHDNNRYSNLANNWLEILELLKERKI